MNTEYKVERVGLSQSLSSIPVLASARFEQTNANRIVAIKLALKTNVSRNLLHCVCDWMTCSDKPLEFERCYMGD
jgi:hypothetical protein